MSNITPGNVAATMRQLRLESGITQTELARRLNITNAGLCYRENQGRKRGKRGNLLPRIDDFVKWAKAMGMEVTITLTPKRGE